MNERRSCRGRVEKAGLKKARVEKTGAEEAKRVEG
jgi:hypothetical protein